MSDRAVIYVRVSDDAQEDGASLPMQELACRQYCTQKGYSVVDVKQETASGVDSLRWRPGMQQVRSLLKSGQANVLVVWRQDRAARDMADGIMLLRELDEYGARMESATEGAITYDSSGRILSAIRYEMGRQERDAIVLRTHAGLRERVEREGMPLVGKHPLFGYRYTYGQGRRMGAQRKTGYEIEPETAGYVLRMFEKIVHDGYSLHRLARLLNDQDVPTPTEWLQEQGMLKDGTRVTPAWSWQMVQRIITNPSYMGKHTVYRRKQEKRTPKDGGQPTYVMHLRPEGDAKAVTLAIPAIVSSELWEQAQAALKARKLDSARRNREPEATLLRGGIARCGVCGSPMHVGLKHERRVYVCGKRRAFVDDAATACPGGGYSIRADIADADVWRKVAEIAQDTEHLERLLQTRRSKITEAWQQAQAEAERERAEIADLEQQKATLARRMATETDDGIYATLRHEMQRVNALLTEFEKRSAATTANAVNIRALRQRIDKILTGKIDASLADVAHQALDFLHSLQSQTVLDSLSYQERRELLSLLGVQVKMYPADSEYARANGKQWEFTFSPESGVTDGTVTRSASTSHKPPRRGPAR